MFRSLRDTFRIYNSLHATKIVTTWVWYPAMESCMTITSIQIQNHFAEKYRILTATWHWEGPCLICLNDIYSLERRSPTPQFARSHNEPSYAGYMNTQKWSWSFHFMLHLKKRTNPIKVLYSDQNINNLQTPLIFHPHPSPTLRPCSSYAEALGPPPQGTVATSTRN